MLYGMDEDHEYIEQEYGLVKTEKLNIKKVVIFVSIIIICFFAMFGMFLKNDKKNNETYKYSVEKSEEKEIVEKDKSEEKINKNSNLNIIQDKDGYYIGKHVQIPLHDTEAIRKKFVPQLNFYAQQEIKNIYSSEEKQVYLTFDDGPSKDITPQVLNILKEHNVKANFFVLGARVDLYPETLRRIFDEGHYIANHGYSHKYSKIYENKDTVFQEYVECEISIKAALNNQDYNSYLFRFPGGSNGGRYSKIKKEAKELLSSYGISYTNWNCMTGDAEGKKTKEECIAELINTKGNQNSLIVLMHDANDKQQTVDSLPDIIQYFKNEGYTFKTFYEIF